MMLEECISFVFDIDPRQMFSTTGRLRLAISVPNKYKEKLVEDEIIFLTSCNAFTTERQIILQMINNTVTHIIKQTGAKRTILLDPKLPKPRNPDSGGQMYNQG